MHFLRIVASDSVIEFASFHYPSYAHHLQIKKEKKNEIVLSDSSFC